MVHHVHTVQTVHTLSKNHVNTNGFYFKEVPT